MEGVPKPAGDLGRCTAPLQLADPFELLLTAVRHQKIGEDLAERSGFSSPADLDHLRERLSLLGEFLCCTVDVSAMRIGAVENEPADAVRMARGICNRNQTTLAQSKKRESAQADGIDHRFNVRHPGIEREIRDVPVRKARASGIMSDQRTPLRESLESSAARLGSPNRFRGA